VAAVSAPTGEPVVESGTASEESADEPELAQQAAATTTAATTAEASVQDRPLTTAVPVPSTLNGESRVVITCTDVAMSDCAFFGESLSVREEVFPGVHSDDDDNDQYSLVVGGRTILRPGSAELSSTVDLPSLASMRDSDGNATTAIPASTSTTAATAADSGTSDYSSNNDADCSSSSISIASAVDHMSTNTISTSTSTSSSSSSSCDSSSSSELMLNVPEQLHGRLQRSAELCRCVHATCILHGLSEEHIAQQCNTVLLLQAEAENGDASSASVEAILVQWLSSSDSPLQPRHHTRQPWLVSIEIKQYTLRKTRQVRSYFILYCCYCTSSHLLMRVHMSSKLCACVMLCVCIKALTTVMLHACTT
jgi:hypothetical protein